MKRPKPLDYNDNSLMLYVTDLENYCNFLEWKIENLNEVLHGHILALDKACEKLAFASDERVIEELGSFQLGELNRTAREWREWAMKDE